MSPHDVPIPARMRSLPLDQRGYPMAKFAFIDSQGNPQFTINDEPRRQHHLFNDLCPICGQALNRFRWFVGGPASAMHVKGCYIDPPMHDECAHYALLVCPYLAAPSYAGRIDDKKLPVQDYSTALFLNDPTMLDYRPDFFVAVCARATTWQFDSFGLIRYVRPTRPYVRWEAWRKGQKVVVSPEEMQAALAKALVGHHTGAVAG